MAGSEMGRRPHSVSSTTRTSLDISGCSPSRFQPHFRQQTGVGLIVYQKLRNMVGDGSLFHQLPFGFGKPKGAGQLTRPSGYPQAMGAHGDITRLLPGVHASGRPQESHPPWNPTGAVAEDHPRGCSFDFAVPNPLPEFALEEAYRRIAASIEGNSP